MPGTGAAPATVSVPPGLLLRLASMIYEAILLFGVAFIVGYAVLALARWTYPLAGYQRAGLQATLFGAFGVYFVWCWTRSGQTLAMKSWQLRLIDLNGKPPRLARAVLRYLLAWLLFAPGLAFVALTQTHAAWDVLALVLSFAAMLLTSLADPQRRLPHDRLLGMSVIRELRPGSVADPPRP